MEEKVADKEVNSPSTDEILSDFINKPQENKFTGGLYKRKCVTEKGRTSWIAKYLEYLQNQESPDIFHIWSAIATISAVLQHKVFIKQGYFTIYPNHYIVMVAASAQCRKSTAIEFPVDKFLSKMDDQVPILSGSSTASGLTDKLVDVGKKGFTDAHGEITSPVHILASELSYSLGHEKERLRIMEFLTDVYGGKKKAEDLTKSGGNRVIHNPCITFIGATTPKTVSQILCSNVLGLGFIGRVIWVFSDSPKPKVAWPEVDDRLEQISEDLFHDLQIINMLRGQFVISEDAKEKYKTWYARAKTSDDAKHQFEQEYLERKGAHVLKLAQVLSIDESNDLIIQKHHVEKSIQLLRRTELEMWKAFRYVGTDTNILATDITSYLYSRPNKEASLAQLTAVFRSRVKTKQELIAPLDLMYDSGLVQKRVLGGKGLTYLLTRVGIDTLESRAGKTIYETDEADTEEEQAKAELALKKSKEQAKKENEAGGF